MSTERIVEAAATMLETWAVSLRVSRDLCRKKIEEGDSDGLGIQYLLGQAAAYDDVADALQASADHARGRRMEDPHLRAVSSTSEERDS